MKIRTMHSVQLVLALLALGARVVADAPPGAPAAATPPPPANYRLVPGDVIDVAVPSHEGYDRTLTIQPDGRIEYPSAGEIIAAGLTPVQLAARIQQALNADLVDPTVTVSLKEINNGMLRRVSVLGAVRNAGVFELKEQASLAELLASAGGPTPVADLRHVTVTQAGTDKKVVVDLSPDAPAGSAKVALQPGDQIMVPEGAPPTVTVLGEVAKPGSYDLAGETRLLNILSQAGGPTPKADLHRVTLTHAGQPGQETLDLQEVITKGEQSGPAATLRLHPGDTVIVPAIEAKYYVLGEVSHADTYPLRPGDHLLDAITTAGGSTHEADLTKVTLIRKDAAGKPVPRQVNLKQMMTQGDMSLNEALQPGDVIFVPDRKHGKSLGEILAPLTGVLYLLR